MNLGGRDHIGQLTDVGVGSQQHDGTVVITIRLDAMDPPAGTVRLHGGYPVAFAGWLGLLRVLSDLMEAATR